MNIALMAFIISGVFFILKMGLKYNEPDPKACIQDAVMAFAASLIGFYAYELYSPKDLGPKTPTVFTERPNF
jgi:hypothetical protein